MHYGAEETAPRRLIGRASIAGAATAYQQGISLTAGLIVARVIGAADYGVFSLARNLVDVTAIMTRLGLQIGLQRYFGESNSVEDSATRMAVLRQLRIIAGAVALLPVLGIALGLGRVLESHVYEYSRFAEVLLYLALALPFATDLAVLGGAYRGVLKLAPAVLAECVLMPTIRLLIIVALFLAGWRLWAVVAGTTVAWFVASVVLALRARSDFGGGEEPTHARVSSEAVRVVRYSSVLAVAVLVTTLTTTMDLLVLGRYATAQDLGQYSLIKTLLVLMGVFGAAFTQGLGALVADRYYRGDLAGMIRVMSLTIRWTALGTLPIFAIFLFWGATLTSLFGSSFAAPQAVVGWLAASQCVFVIFNPAGWALSMTGKHLLELKILIAGLAIAVLLCSIAVPLLGQLGAALAACAALGTTNLARVLVVRRSAGALPFGADLFVIGTAAIGLAWVSRAVLAQLALPALWGALLGVACFGVIYAGAAWAYLLNVDEKNGIRSLLGGTVRALSRNLNHV